MVTFLLAAAGCGGVSVGSGNEVTGTVPDDAGTTLASPTISVSGFVQAVNAGWSPLSGVTVCQQECTTSGSDGSFKLSGVPANQFVSLTFQKDGFLPSLRVMETQGGDITLPSTENAMFPVSTPQTFMGATVDPSKGDIAFFVAGPGAAPKVSVTINWVNGSAYEPIYFAPNAPPGSATTAGPSGGFVNVREGQYIVRFGAPGVTCVASGLYGYPVTDVPALPPGEAAILVTVRAGYVTTPVSAWCVSW